MKQRVMDRKRPLSSTFLTRIASLLWAIALLYFPLASAHGQMLEKKIDNIYENTPTTAKPNSSKAKSGTPDTVNLNDLPPEARETIKALAESIRDEREEETKSAKKDDTPVAIKRGWTPPTETAPKSKKPAIRQEKGYTHSDSGIDIKLRDSSAPKLSATDNLLEQAYQALIMGQTEAAVYLYQQILKDEPENTAALLGLATTYQRDGELTQARKIYTRLLKINPHHKEGLNNFLALVGQQAPEQALQELLVLKEANPDFSPVHAQLGMLYMRLNQFDKAVESLKTAITLSPNNMAYRYNLAILLDHMGQWVPASILYKQLLQAYSQGISVPGSVQNVQDRLTYITSMQPTTIQ